MYFPLRIDMKLQSNILKYLTIEEYFEIFNNHYNPSINELVQLLIRNKVPIGCMSLSCIFSLFKIQTAFFLCHLNES